MIKIILILLLWIANFFDFYFFRLNIDTSQDDCASLCQCALNALDLLNLTKKLPLIQELLAREKAVTLSQVCSSFTIKWKLLLHFFQLFKNFFFIIFFTGKVYSRILIMGSSRCYIWGSPWKGICTSTLARFGKSNSFASLGDAS